MEWLIDIIKEWLQLYLKGMIVMWHGLIVDIPDGWALCDGTKGTPDLTFRFIQGVTVQPQMGLTGGEITHTHDFTCNTHDHEIELMMTADGVEEGFVLAGTDNGPISTETTVVTGTTDTEPHLPTYYRLAFIMKL